MLPFLKHKDEASVSAPPSSIKRTPDEEPEYDMLEAAAEDLVEAIGKKDIKAIAAALRAAFEICDAMPHEEGPHI